MPRLAHWRRTTLAALALTASLPLVMGTASPAAVAAPSPIGTITTIAGGPGEGAATNVAQQPTALARQGNRLYVADAYEESHSVVRVVDLTTGSEQVLTACERACVETVPTASSPPSFATGIAVDLAGNVYVASTSPLPPAGEGWPGTIKKITPAGAISLYAGSLDATTTSPRGDGGPATSATLRPQGMAFGPDGALYVADAQWKRIRRIDSQGVITTAVGFDPPPGDYSRNWGADGRPAVETQLERPLDVAFGPDGALHFVDADSGRARKVDPATGLVRTVLLYSPPDSRSTYPRGVTVDPQGNVLVAGIYQVWRITPQGAISLFAGVSSDPGHPGSPGDGGPATEATFGFLTQRDILTDGATTFIADVARVRRVNALGIIATVAGNGSVIESGNGGPATSARLKPEGTVFADGQGTVYLYESNRRVAPDGTISAVTDGQVVGADSHGRHYIWEDWRLFRVDGSGQRTHIAGDGSTASPDHTHVGLPATQIPFGGPVALAITPSGEIYFNQGFVVIRRIDAEGIFRTVAGQPVVGPYVEGQPATRAWMKIQGFAVDPAGNVYIADGYYRRIRRVDTQGIITTVGGNGAIGHSGDGGPARAASFWFSYDVDGMPVGMAADGAGNVFLSDPANSRVRRINAAGIVTTAVGSRRGLGGDGGPATSASLNGPAGLATAPGGDLLIADRWNHRIRRVAGVAPATPPGPAFVWGWNAASRPAAIPVVGAVTDAAAGFYHTLLLRIDGTVWASGSNNAGQLGTGFEPDARSAVRVGGITGVTAVAAGALHSLALKSDGTVWAWGHGSLGQLGNGTVDNKPVPTRVAGLTDVVTIAAGAFHSVALKSDGTVWTWGWNVLGQVGDGTVANRLAPVRAVGLTGATSISAGVYHTLAATNSGGAWAWGWNGLGQLGDGTTNDRLVPGHVLLGTPVASVAAGAYHSLARTNPGTVVAWGWNGYGQLGDGTTNDRRTPVAVTGLTGVAEVSAGVVHNLARTTSGAAYAWGWNALGQLGDGTTIDRRTPVAITALPSATTISAGALHSLATSVQRPFVGRSGDAVSRR